MRYRTSLIRDPINGWAGSPAVVCLVPTSDVVFACCKKNGARGRRDYEMVGGPEMSHLCGYRGGS